MSDIESLRALLAAMEEHHETNERAEFLLDLLDRLKAAERERDAALRGWDNDRELRIYWKACAEAAEAKVVRGLALADEWDAGGVNYRPTAADALRAALDGES